VRKAEADFAGAGQLAKARPPLHDPLCFHCQQAAEKYLKALLCEHGIPVPRIHDLDVLLNLAIPGQPRSLGLRRAVNVLTQYAVEYCYPGSHASSRQARAALRHATRVREHVRHALALPVKKR
jgi:HEPN domain-containing protein